MNILLIGATGQLGQELHKTLAQWDSVIPLSHEGIDIADFKKVRSVILEIQPDIVINTAAYHRVAECETNIHQSFFLNSFCVRHLALCCKKAGALLMHFSTDYVFDGKKRKAYRESDNPNPVNVYGLSKLAGEKFIREILPEHYIIRVSGLFGGSGSRQKGGNFLTHILEKAKQEQDIQVASDMVFSPTYAPDCAKVMAGILQNGQFGTYHVTNAGFCSWYEFASAFFQFLSMKIFIKAVSYNALRMPVARPMYSVLESNRITELNISKMRPWKEALLEYCRRIKYF